MSVPDLSVALGSVELPNPIIAASGTFGHGDELARVCPPVRLGSMLRAAGAGRERTQGESRRCALRPAPARHRLAALLDTITVLKAVGQRWSTRSRVRIPLCPLQVVLSRSARERKHEAGVRRRIEHRGETETPARREDVHGARRDPTSIDELCVGRPQRTTRRRALRVRHPRDAAEDERGLARQHGG